MDEHTGNADIGARAAAFDLYDPALQEDPHPLFTALREQCPVAHADTYGGYWLVSKYDDVMHVLLHPELFSSVEMLIPSYEHPRGKQIPVEIDPPAHTRYRQGLAPMFTPAAARRLASFIEGESARLVDEIVARGNCEFIRDFAVPLPVAIFLHLFGLPPESVATFMAYKDAMLHGGLSSDEDHHGELVSGKSTVAEAFEDALAQRRREGLRGDDLVTKVARLGEGLDAWNDDEIIRALLTLMLGSLDTTTSALGLMFEHLARHHDHRDAIASDPSLAPAVVEELLRYEPFTYIARLVVAPCSLGGVDLVPGDRVQLLFGAAGRDPDAFEEADEVRFDRPSTTRQLAFGAGIHRCLGIHQARTTLQIALQQWHARIPRYSIAEGTSAPKRLTHVRGVEHLHLVVE